MKEFYFPKVQLKDPRYCEGCPLLHPKEAMCLQRKLETGRAYDLKTEDINTVRDLQICLLKECVDEKILP